MANFNAKDMISFKEILGIAHAAGLSRVDTELLQLPTAENDNTCVFRAVVEMAEGKTFSGTGDANPRNVGKMIVPHIIRMAETRALARALRFATNTGQTTFEEMGGDDAPHNAPQTPPPSNRGNNTPPPTNAAPPANLDAIIAIEELEAKFDFGHPQHKQNKRAKYMEGAIDLNDATPEQLGNYHRVLMDAANA